MKVCMLKQVQVKVEGAKPIQRKTEGAMRSLVPSQVGWIMVASGLLQLKTEGAKRSTVPSQVKVEGAKRSTVSNQVEVKVEGAKGVKRKLSGRSVGVKLKVPQGSLARALAKPPHVGTND